MKKGIVLLITFSVCMTILSGCGAGTGYHFKMAASSTVQTPPSRMIYSDNFIDISFTVAEADEKGVEGDRQFDQYKGVSFILNNKTDHPLTIDWNKIAFKDFRGSSGNAVMSKNRNYKECAGVKPSTVVPPKGKIEDVIIPCYGVVFSSGANAHWDLSFLPSPRVSPIVDFGIYMPLQFGKNIKSYGFNFIAESRSGPDR